MVLDIEIYNLAMERSWVDHKKDMNLSGELQICEHCSRKYSICCICDKAEARWASTIKEIQEISQRDRTGE